MKKIVSLLIITAILIANIPINTFAASVDSTNTTVDDTIIYFDIWENPNKNENDDTTNQNPNARYGEREVVEVIQTETVYITTKPSGQPPKGYSFPDYGGSVYVDVTGGVDLSISVSVAWDTISIGLGAGYASTTPSANGFSVNFPANNNYYLVKLNHEYLVKQLKIDYYKYNEYVSTAYVTRYYHQSIQPFLEQVT